MTLWSADKRDSSRYGRRVIKIGISGSSAREFEEKLRELKIIRAIEEKVIVNKGRGASNPNEII